MSESATSETPGLSSRRRSDLWDTLAGLVREHRGMLVSVAVREGMQPEEALECVQDALCTWLAQSQSQGQNRGQRAGSPYPAWLSTLKLMVKNAARNGRRRHHRLRPHLPIDDDSALAAATLGAEQLLDEAETSMRLKVCVAQLREVERAVVTLRLLEEHSGEDVARMLGLSRSHVDVLVHRAKATLRVCMGPSASACATES